MNSRPISSSLSCQAYKARPLPIGTFRFMSITCDFQRTISINSFVDAFGELRKRDARSSFSRQYLGSILEPSTDLLTPSAKLSTSAEGISLCESSQVEYMSKAADSLGEVEQLVLDQRAVAGRARVRCGAARKDQRACRAEERPARNGLYDAGSIGGQRPPPFMEVGPDTGTWRKIKAVLRADGS